MAINSDMKPHAMGLYSEMLQDFRDNLDEMLRMLVLNMTDRDLMEGVLTAKIKIVMKIYNINWRIKTLNDKATKH